MKYLYSNNGMSMRSVNDNHTPETNELLLDHQASLSELWSFFPQYITHAQQEAVERMDAARENAMWQPLSNGSLGVNHTYSVSERNINFLNNLITLGNGSKFTCIDMGEIKARRFHDHSQLMALAVAIEAHISAQFDHYESKLFEIYTATDKASLDAVAW